MKKLKLQVDALRVESFPVAAPAGEKPGTVRAHEAEAPTQPVQYCFFSVFPTCGIYC
jgi:hypothetical protein